MGYKRRRVYKQARAGMQARVYNMRVKIYARVKKKYFSPKEKRGGGQDDRDAGKRQARDDRSGLFRVSFQPAQLTFNSRSQDLIFMLVKAPVTKIDFCDKN